MLMSAIALLLSRLCVAAPPGCLLWVAASDESMCISCPNLPLCDELGGVLSCYVLRACIPLAVV